MGIGNIFVVEFFCKPLSEKQKSDLMQIVQTYNSKEKDMRDMLQGCPSIIIEWKGQAGIVVPFRDEKELTRWLSFYK